MRLRASAAAGTWLLPVVLALATAAQAGAQTPPSVPALVASASASVVVGGPVWDSTTIAGPVSPTGSVAFSLFGPDDPLCRSPSLFRSVVGVHGDGSYRSAPFITLRPGIYRWVASYSGDSANAAVQSPCDDLGQWAVVTMGIPSLVTVATPAIALGGSATDSVVISRGFRPTGTLMFKLFGPADDRCAAAPVIVFPALAVNGNGTYLSPSFTPAAPGTFRFTVDYSGDANNLAQSSRCDAGSQAVVVSPAPVTITSSRSPPVTLGQAVVGQAVVGGGERPTGSIVFSFFGPGDPACSAGAVFVTAPVTVWGDGQYLSPPFTPARTGRYPFVATYSGDGDNAGQASACTGPSATPEVTRAALTFNTDVVVPVNLGGTIVGSETLAGGHAPTGTIVFSFFGPGDPTCSAPPVFASDPVAVNGDGRYISAPYRPPTAGTYHFVAAYSGDEGNLATATACSALNQSIEVKDIDARSRKLIALEISVFALMAVVGAGGGRKAADGPAPPTAAPAAPPDPSPDPSQGSVIALGIDNSDEGWEGFELVGVEAGGRTGIGDRSRTWQWPGTARVDRFSSALPQRVAPASPTLALVLNDGGYLRALLGSAALVFPVTGVLLGVLSVHDTGGRTLPPAFGLAMALAVLSVLDASAGFAGLAIFVAGVVAFGGVTTLNHVRTLLGLSALWFAAPLIAGTVRPMRRAPTTTVKEHWDRMADVVIGSLFGAWAVEQILGGLPGLAGVPALPIADKAKAAALIVLAALAVRLVFETIAAHWYPTRLRQVHRGPIPGSSAAQHLWAALIGGAIFVFVAVPYIGPCWQLWAGGAVFAVPLTLRIYKDRFPNARRLYSVLPQGILRAVVLLVVGGLCGGLVLNLFQSHPKQLIRDSFVLLSLPCFAVSMLDLFARDGEVLNAPHWLRQLMGTFVLVAGLLLVIGVVTVDHLV